VFGGVCCPNGRGGGTVARTAVIAGARGAIRGAVAVGASDSPGTRKTVAKSMGWRRSIDSGEADIRLIVGSSRAGVGAGAAVAGGKAGDWARQGHIANDETRIAASAIVNRLDCSIGRGSFAVPPDPSALRDRSGLIGRRRIHRHFTMKMLTPIKAIGSLPFLSYCRAKGCTCAPSPDFLRFQICICGQDFGMPAAKSALCAFVGVTHFGLARRILRVRSQAKSSNFS
jgi:hypothetical protein